MTGLWLLSDVYVLMEALEEGVWRCPLGYRLVFPKRHRPILGAITVHNPYRFPSPRRLRLSLLISEGIMGGTRVGERERDGRCYLSG